MLSSSICSLKMDCEKLVQEKTEMQRHYVMVMFFSVFSPLCRHFVLTRLNAAGVRVGNCGFLQPIIASLYYSHFFVIAVLRNVLWTQRGNAQTGNFDARPYIEKSSAVAAIDKLRMKKTEREAPCFLLAQPTGSRKSVSRYGQSLLSFALICYESFSVSCLKSLSCL